MQDRVQASTARPPGRILSEFAQESGAVRKRRSQGGAKLKTLLTEAQRKEIVSEITQLCEQYGVQRKSLVDRETPGSKEPEQFKKSMPIVLAQRLFERLRAAIIAKTSVAERQTVGREVLERMCQLESFRTLCLSPCYPEALSDAELRNIGRDPKIYKKHALDAMEIGGYSKGRINDEGKFVEVRTDPRTFRKEHAPRVPMLLPQGWEPRIARILIEMLAARGGIARNRDTLNNATAVLSECLKDMAPGSAVEWVHDMRARVLTNASADTKALAGDVSASLLFRMASLMQPQPNRSDIGAEDHA